MRAQGRSGGRAPLASGAAVGGDVLTDEESVDPASPRYISMRPDCEPMYIKTQDRPLALPSVFNSLSRCNLELFKKQSKERHDTRLPFGECIGSALIALLPSHVALDVRELIRGGPVNEKGTRPYSFFADLLSRHNLGLFQHPDLYINMLGDYLIHSDCGGTPHCMGLHVPGHKVTLYDEHRVYELHRDTLQQLLYNTAEHHTVRVIRIDASTGPTVVPGPCPPSCPPVPVSVYEAMHGDLEAGAKKSRGTAKKSEVIKRPAASEAKPIFFVPPARRLATKHTVRRAPDEPVKKLLCLLAQECQEYYDELVPYSRPESFICRPCPSRCKPFARMDRLKEHLLAAHTWKDRFTPTGTKQMRVIVSLYDNDLVTNKPIRPTYLARSTEILKASAPAASGCTKLNKYDRQIRLVLDLPDPRYVDTARIETGGIYLQASQHYSCTRAFATEVFRQFAISHGNFNDTKRMVQRRMQAAGSQLHGLLPGLGLGPGRSVWFRLAELIFYSPTVGRILADCYERAYYRNEWSSLSIDGTYKLTMRLKGQKTYRDTFEMRAQAAVPDNEAKYTVFSIRGRTGMLAGLPLLNWEREHLKAGAVEECIRPKWRAQVRHICYDDPSRVVLLAMQDMCPGLKVMSKDPRSTSTSHSAAGTLQRTDESGLQQKRSSTFV